GRRGTAAWFGRSSRRLLERRGFGVLYHGFGRGKSIVPRPCVGWAKARKRRAHGLWARFALRCRRVLRPTPPRAGLGHAQERLQHAAIGAQGRARTLVDDAAAFEDHGAVGNAQDLVRVLLDQDGGKTLLAHDPLERRDQLLDDDGREAFERLVEQDDARIEHERAPDREHLLLAAGELVAEIAAAFGEARKQLIDARRRPGA